MLTDATLVLLGHGSTKNTDSADAVFLHASELRGRKLFAEVREAFWKQEPDILQVLSVLSTPRVFIAPLFMSEGFFGREVIPRALGFEHSSIRIIPPSTLNPLARRSEAKTAQPSTQYYCQPVGTHPALKEILLARARAVTAAFPFPRAPRPEETTLFIAGHGTEKTVESRETVDQQVQWLRERNEYAAVHGIFMEEAPRIGECYELARTKNMIVVPYFISEGMHTREDIPVLLGEPRQAVQRRLAKGVATWHNPTERNGKLVWYAPPVGTDRRIADVILERVREASVQ